MCLIPQTDSLWSKITQEERREVSTWVAILKDFENYKSMPTAQRLGFINAKYASTLGREIAKPTLYRIRAAVGSGVILAVLGATAVRRAKGVKRSTEMPPLFISFVRKIFMGMQRDKFKPVFEELIYRLRRGDVMPGYGTDWRGIYAGENPGSLVPEVCPYNDLIGGAAACQPRGWSYSNLMSYMPGKDIRMARTRGVQAMHKFNPRMPQDRAAIAGAMSVITMDDVKLDVFAWYPGEDRARRPAGLGVLDVKTGNIVNFLLLPAQEREDGTISGLNGEWRRYVWAQIFCGIGVAEGGVTFLAEHGTAGLTDEMVREFNAILGPGPITDGPAEQNPFVDPNDPDAPGKGVWLVVLRASTSGAPIMQGLYRERARGLSNHKSPIESAWNKLHNVMAAKNLPGPSGKDWDNAPQDQEGWEREDRMLIETAAVLARKCPEAVEKLHEASTVGLSYNEVCAATEQVIETMNHRREHALQGWTESGYTVPVVEFGGSVVSVSDAARAMAPMFPEASFDELLKRATAQAKAVRMSPAEAWAKETRGGKLKRFSPFVATQILGERLAQRVTVDAHVQFTAIDDLSKKRMLYSARITQEDGSPLFLGEGTKLKVWVNPAKPDFALVSQEDGVFLGLATCLTETVYGNRTKHGNLAELAKVRAEQTGRAQAAFGGLAAAAVERRERNMRAIAGARAAAGATPSFKGVEAADVMALTDNGEAVSSPLASEAPEEESFLSRMTNI